MRKKGAARVAGGKNQRPTDARKKDQPRFCSDLENRGT
jgi:hypothetical protein